MNKRERLESRPQTDNCKVLCALVMSAALLLSGCVTEYVIVEQDQPAAQQATEAKAEEIAEEEETTDNDPLEGFNRTMYDFNEKVDTYIAEPITDVYRWVFPQFVQTGVSNFYANMRGIGVFINDFLQAKFAQGASDTGRFALNTTVGLLGLIDVAGYVGLEQHDEDFGQTLAVWGVPAGPYLVLPFVGPGTFREIPGSIVDAAVHPATYLPVGFAAVAALNRRANAEESLKFIDEAALDPYVFTRESYLQFREHQVTDGEGETSVDIDEFDEELFADEDLEEEDSPADDGDAVSPAASEATDSANAQSESDATNAGEVPGVNGGIEAQGNIEAEQEKSETANNDAAETDPVNMRRRNSSW